jgi:hypothetical protein
VNTNAADPRAARLSEQEFVTTCASLLTVDATELVDRPLDSLEALLVLLLLEDLTDVPATGPIVAPWSVGDAYEAYRSL